MGVDKSSGKQEKITITNDKGRLLKEEIERMVSDAEKFKAEDDKQKERIAARNSLESYCFNMKSTIEDEKLKDKFGETERKTIMDKCNEVIAWLDSNQTAEEDEYKDKQKEVEGICNPIITKLYRLLEVPQEVCLEVCHQVQEVCLVLEVPQEQDQDLLLKRLINMLEPKHEFCFSIFSFYQGC